MAEIKIGGKTRFENLLKQLFHSPIIPFTLGYEVIITNSRYALVGYFITSYPTWAHGIIVICLTHILLQTLRFQTQFSVVVVVVNLFAF